jgi:homoserine kinase type II
MAVYTHIEDSDVILLLEAYGLGKLVSFAGITEGIDNSNYFIKTEDARYILTIFEKRIIPEEIPFYISLMNHLRKKGIPSPGVLTTKNGREIVALKGKPAILSTFLDGTWPRNTEIHHCMTVGSTLAHMHLAVADFMPKRKNNLSIPAWQALISTCRDQADSLEIGLYDFLDQELEHLEKKWPRRLPRGGVHADLFTDNVFFDGEKMTGVIDFYFACTEYFAYDLMLVVNSWCFDHFGKIDRRKVSALMESYQKIRPLSKAEIAALPLLGRAGAMRIVATRLYDWLNRIPGALVKPKDPLEHVRILRFHQNATPQDYGVSAE